MGAKTRRTKTLVGVVALAAGFAAATLQPSQSLAFCGKDAGCSSGRGDHDAGFSPPAS